MSKITRDPVCHMEILQEKAAAERHKGTTAYWFCSTGCADLFDRQPERYVASSGSERTEFQLIIIGGGPAGLTAALYASIQRMNTLLVTSDLGGQAVESTAMENYMGFQVVEGRDLVGRFRDQLLRAHFVEHRLDRAQALTITEQRFHVSADRGGHYISDTVILATGMKRRMLNVPGEERLLHRGVSFSVVQDAELFQGRDLAIVGGGNSALQTVVRLGPIGRRLFLIARQSLTGDAADIERARGLPNLTVFENTRVTEVLGQEQVEGVRVTPTPGGEQRELPVRGVFVEIGYTPNADLARDLVETNSRGEIVIGPDCSTRTPGLFAAGDVTTGYGKRVIIACGEGAKAALAAHAYLREK